MCDQVQMVTWSGKKVRTKGWRSTPDAQYQAYVYSSCMLGRIYRTPTFFKNGRGRGILVCFSPFHWSLTLYQYYVIYYNPSFYLLSVPLTFTPTHKTKDTMHINYICIHCAAYIAGNSPFQELEGIRGIIRLLHDKNRIHWHALISVVNLERCAWLSCSFLLPFSVHNLVPLFFLLCPLC